MSHTYYIIFCSNSIIGSFILICIYLEYEELKFFDQVYNKSENMVFNRVFGFCILHVL